MMPASSDNWIKPNTSTASTTEAVAIDTKKRCRNSKYGPAALGCASASCFLGSVAPVSLVVTLDFDKLVI